MLYIKNVRRYDTGEPISILIEGGVITDIGDVAAPNSGIIIDGKGCVVSPGLFDMHVHLRDPGQVSKGDIFTETTAAAAGGVTSLAAMPNTIPTADSVEVIEYIRDKAKMTKVRVFPVGAVTKGLRGEVMTDFDELKAAGAFAFSDDGMPIENDDIMTSAMLKADALNCPLISHCEDMEFARGGKVNTGAAEKLGVAAMHPAGEYNMVKKHINLAEKCGGAVHIAHISTKESVEAVREAKKRGVRVTCETCPHYFSLTEDLTLSRDADYRMNPPLRTKQDVKAIIEGLRDGTIDAIVTDHAPHTLADKADFETAPNGVVGMETSLAAGITYLVRTGILTLKELIEKMSYNPSKIMNIMPVTLDKGSTADIILFNENLHWEVFPKRLHGKSRNAVYKGMKLYGKVIMTVVGGDIKYKLKNGE